MTGTSGSSGDYVYGYPQYAPENAPQYVPYPHYVLVPGSPRRVRSRKTCILWSACKFLLVALLLVSLATLGYMLFPREPEVEVRKIMLEKISLHVDEAKSILPSVHLDVRLSLLLKITNYNFFGVVYDNILVYFYYRGDDLGKVESVGGKVPSRSVVLATATLNLQGTELLQHATDLISDVSNGVVPMETVTEFSGTVEMFSLRPRIKMQVFCSMLIDPSEKEVIEKHCSLLPWLNPSPGLSASRLANDFPSS